MKIVGLAAEYNPFHNGHLYHINKAKELTGADHVIVAMSGDFVQRGAPAVMPKHLRAKAALNAGASLVLELPVCFALGSAEYFAEGAVALFEQLGCVDALCFGSECGDITEMEQIADILSDEPEEYRADLRSLTGSGVSWPQARQQALLAYLNRRSADSSLSGILSFPNNILGIEYIRAIRKRNSRIRPCTVQRRGADYHDGQFGEDCASATAIRNILSAPDTKEPSAAASPRTVQELQSRDADALSSKSMSLLASHMPSYALKLLEHAHHVCCPVLADDFSALLKYRLLSETRESLTGYLDVDRDLANRILNRRNEFIRIEQFTDLLKTKEITRSRISRCLFHILLGITSADTERFREEASAWYARVLGFREDSLELLTVIKKSSGIPLITKLSQADALCEPAKRMLERDRFAADLYESIVTDKFGTPFIDEKRKPVVRIQKL